ncbi:MAG: dephospho-CoA kinase [Candidatus Sericytochromatia bacterium]|nr:dephospho-CoA kinase [Candidatus Sericytochromatia bacterium]
MISLILTGSVATGKTTVSNFMQEQKAIIIDTDLLTHGLYDYPSPTINKLVDTFGENILDKDLSVDRKKLAKIVFNDPESLKKLNDIVHPDVRAKVNQVTKYYQDIETKLNKNFLIVYVIPLYFEAGKNYTADYIVVATCSKEKQLERLIKRGGYSLDEAERRIDTQISITEKIKYSNYIIDTNQDFDKIKNNVYQLLASWKWDRYEESYN